MEKTKILTGGLTNCLLPVEEYEMCEGIKFRKIFSHFMHTNTMAFSRALPGKHHPAPWVALPGSTGEDIEVELVVDEHNLFHSQIEIHTLIWLIVSLIRIAYKPDINIIILSKCGIEEMKNTDGNDVAAVYETKKRRFKRDDAIIELQVLDWIKENLSGAINLYKKEQYKTLLHAFDYAQYNELTSTSMISIWGALEQVFSANAGELRYRVSISLATYIEEIGQKRYDLYKKIQKLYDERSNAAHRNAKIKMEDLLESFYILSQIIIKITERKTIPDQETLEKMILAPEKKDD